MLIEVLKLLNTFVSIPLALHLIGQAPMLKTYKIIIFNVLVIANYVCKSSVFVAFIFLAEVIFLILIYKNKENDNHAKDDDKNTGK